VEIKEYSERLCGLVVRVLDYSTRGPGFDSVARSVSSLAYSDHGVIS
jgi:hypothetical protein